MAIIFISLSAFFASAITLFSGFGLGTILMPVIAIFLPLQIAIAVTAIVHLLNNLFKLLLLYKNIDYKILISFGIPAFIFSVLGAYFLDLITSQNIIFEYNFLGKTLKTSLFNLVVGVSLIIFASAEIFPFLNKINKIPNPIGGALSGFFGGFSGHQGAFRSAFLIKANLTKEGFVATNSAIASLVDIARIIVYGLTFNLALIEKELNLIIIATFSGFLGVFLATKILKKITIKYIQILVALMLYILAILLIFGVL
ncbi:MAG: sulfite exporter TauE/SafE family protein [Rickettsiales bacterium]|nr:sulfite exporter TauE/SafE family protein [Rickettsiales bacterium]